MDFIYIEDLCKVVDYYIEKINKKNLPKDMNLCYSNHKSLLDIANKINDLAGKPYTNIVVRESGFYTEYTGDGSRLFNMNIQLLGLDEGLKRCIDV